ncbi:MAG: hypothetical protein JSW64_07875 [Candidatus Zixiibacteriota bacterium]|nr:MAG: hypothetical protein JSW64_07875 [candidate division Zixibacteria bacterium]
MTDIVEYNDLCTTCNYGSDCVRRKHHGKPVLYCEEFDDYQPPREKPTRGFAEYEPYEKTELSRLSEDRARGLCAFCDSQQTCTLPKKEGGVWNCEEYS